MTTPRRTARRLTAPLAGTLALTMALGPAPRALGDDLDAQQQRVRAAKAQNAAALDEVSGELASAQAAFTSSQAELADARTALAQAQQRTGEARATDARLAAAEKTARQQLAAAQAAVAENQRRLADQKKLVGQSVRQTQQQNTELLGIATLVSDTRNEDVNQTIQWSDTIFNATQAQMDRLHEAQAKLQAALAARDAATRTVARQHDAAEQQLALTRAAEQAAATAQQRVQAAVVQHQKVVNALAARVKAEKARQVALAAEDKAVAARIQARIAAQRAAAAAGSAASNPTSGFMAPVDGPVTSPYGMRFHPVLHVWKLHDGMDFGADCATPMRAARDGVVTEEYYNPGYGNRLMIDHGMVDGHYLTTGYNHAQRYVVSVGQRVSKGQVVGYVGSTGFSTGCHLHLMVWRDGSVVNPALYF